MIYNTQKKYTGFFARMVITAIICVFGAIFFVPHNSVFAATTKPAAAKPAAKAPAAKSTTTASKCIQLTVNAADSCDDKCKGAGKGGGVTYSGGTEQAGPFPDPAKKFCCCTKAPAAAAKAAGSTSGGGAGAATPSFCSGTTCVFENPLVATTQGLVGRIIAALFTIIGSIGLIMFIWGGVLWLTAAGNDEHIKDGWNTMIWSALGMGAMFGAYVGVKFIIDGLSQTMK